MTNDKDSAAKDVLDRWCDSEVRQPTQREEDLATALRMTAGACADHINTILQLRAEIAALRQSTQSDVLREAVIEECAKALEADAKLCDCAALEERECGCGA